MLTTLALLVLSKYKTKKCFIPVKTDFYSWDTLGILALGMILIGLDRFI